METNGNIPLEKTKSSAPIKSNKCDFIEILKRIKDLEYECMLMMRYMSNNQINAEQELTNELAEIACNIKSIENSSTTCPSDDKSKENLYGRLLQLHGKLNLKIKPANATSIRFTEISSYGYLEVNWVVNILILLTITSLIFFILFTRHKYRNAQAEGKLMMEYKQKVQLDSIRNDSILYSEEIETPVIDTTSKESPRAPFGSKASVWLILSASALGAGFYTLLTVRKYLINRTFNPRYNYHYVIRFILGIISGVMLALIFSDQLHKNGENYSVEVIAIVGGFAADAVSIILNRLAEILKTALVGTDENSTGKKPKNDDLTERETT